MINEAIFHGLIAALARGESLQGAMLTFYNAGYGKQEIEDAARELHKQTGGQAEKMINPKKISERDKIIYQQIKKQESKPVPQDFTGAKQTSNKQKIQSKRELRRDSRMLNKQNKRDQLKPVQIISKYGEADKTANELKKKIEQAISSLKGIKMPSKVEVIHQQAEKKPPIIIQEISGYGAPPKQINKSVTLLLIFILILLFGALAAVFFFKEQLIEIFNKLSID
ncbi:MAG: hypothetical protein ABIE36_02500 [Candidatus Diapherotrites archaeon]